MWYSLVVSSPVVRASLETPREEIYDPGVPFEGYACRQGREVERKPLLGLLFFSHLLLKIIY